MLTAYRRQVSGGGGIDKFRIKITGAPGAVIYDNRWARPRTSTTPTRPLWAGGASSSTSNRDPEFIGNPEHHE